MILAHLATHRTHALVVFRLLRFFLGVFGAHKFYLLNTKMGILYLVLTLLGCATVFFFVGWAFFIAVSIMWFIDIFTLPGQVRRANDLAAQNIADFNRKVSGS